MNLFVRVQIAAFVWIAVMLAGSVGRAAEPTPADRALERYWAARVRAVAESAFANVQSRADWESRREERRRELLDMLGLWPLPQRTDLRATVTGTIEGDGFTVEKLHFQSLPGLYVTGNLYRPRETSGRLPAILYVCGHARVVTNGVSCGNKTGYQHHGIWFARHGYVCLLIDTLQLGEIEGLHHGTSRLGQWWWNSRGYSPAGVEAWNCMRAIDYLQGRPDVNPEQIGMTGRSGGGSYTWTTAAIDPRIRVAAPVAGITDLEDHVVGGIITGHCDCMFFVNTHRWDFGLNAALIAPRPLLIVNTDSDSIFPLDGVMRVHGQVRRVYDWFKAGTSLGLVIAPGPHRDTQDLQVPVFRWFDQHLRGKENLVEAAAVKLIDPLRLRVFDTLPADERNTRAQEWFGSAAKPAGLEQAGQGDDATMARLRSRVFGGWSSEERPITARLLQDEVDGGRRLRSWEFESEPHVPLVVHVMTRGEESAASLELRVVDEATWTGALKDEAGFRRAMQGVKVDEGHAVAWLFPRGIGPGAWTGDARDQLQIRRRFMLLGQTLDGMRVWDIRRAVQMLRREFPRAARVELSGEGGMGVNALHAALFEPGIARVSVRRMPDSYLEAPDYLNILQVLDLPETIRLAARRGVEVARE